jgi:L-rhamnose-H+ transport protein
MIANPFRGVVFHWLGGLASGSFYVPYRGVKKWAWEVYWLVGGFFSWIIAPWLLASIQTRDLLGVLRAAPTPAMLKAYVFGMLWGVGGLTFGLTMRYLGMSLGMAVALGYCAVIGTIVPPIIHGEFVSKVLGTTSGLVILIGILVCVLGIVIAGLAGVSKEREMNAEQKQASIKEFNFVKGLLVATFSGVFSACFAFGLDAAEPLARLSAERGTSSLWVGLPKLCVVLLGGFTTNVVWCLLLNRRNKTGYQYFHKTLRPAPAGPGTAAPAGERVPMTANYLFCALAGTVWYLQFFFYTMGETQMGQYKFSSWTIHMASIILFSSLWGIALKEWKGSSGYTKTLLGVGLGVLIYSTVIVGYGNYLAAPPAAQGETAMAETQANAAGDRTAGEQEKAALIARQLDAYNAHDLEAFLGFYAADARFFEPPDVPVASGLDYARARYAKRFAETPEVHCRIEKRIIQGDYVIDQEFLTGLVDGATERAVVMYKVGAGKIQAVWFVR